MTKEMKRPTSHISGNSIKPALSKAVEFYTDNNRQAYECIRERDEYIDYLESKLSNAKPQQALPVVPECVGEFIEFAKTEHLNLFNRFDVVMTDEKVSAWLSDSKAYDSGERRDEILARAWLDGYTVEKPQLFYIELSNVYGLSDSVFVSKVENGTILEFTKGKDYALALTEQEIKSIDKRYWQFAVPVEDGE